MERLVLRLREWWFVWVILLVFASVVVAAYKQHTATSVQVPESDLLPGKPLVIESGVYVITLEADNSGTTRVKVGRR